jgi:hypothetical protein
VRPAAFFFALIAAYFSAKGWFRKRAGAVAPETIALMPSALWPWRFFGVAESGNRVCLFQVNAITGNREMSVHQEVLDANYAELLATVPEYGLMRELSPAYHVVSANKIGAGEIIVCRDLRTRNFKTTFGDLEVLLDANKSVVGTTFHI